MSEYEIVERERGRERGGRKCGRALCKMSLRANQQQQEPSTKQGIVKQSTAGKEVRGPWRISRVLAVS